MKVQTVLPRDAIRSIDTPEFASEYFGDAGDELIVVEGDPPRAYPIRTLSYHEIVNDTTDDTPVAVTWCPICWSAVAYERTVDGRTLTFGTSGKLADDALVMYDRETGSEWRQPSGECLAGEFEGHTLTAVPTATTTWRRFTGSYPGGVVLQPVRGGAGPGQRSPAREYDMEPYRQYYRDDDFGLYAMRGEGARRTWDRDDLDAKALVLGIEHEDEAVGYPLERVEMAGGFVTDTVGGQEVVVVAAEGELHAFVNPGFEFERNRDALIADGTRWNPRTGHSDDSRRLDRVAARTLFAFAWQDDHGPDAFYPTMEGER